MKSCSSAAMEKSKSALRGLRTRRSSGKLLVKGAPKKFLFSRKRGVRVTVASADTGSNSPRSGLPRFKDSLRINQWRIRKQAEALATAETVKGRDAEIKTSSVE